MDSSPNTLMGGLPRGPAGATALSDWGAIFLLTFTLLFFLVPVFIIFPPIPVEKSDALRVTHSKVGLSPSESSLRTRQNQDVEGKAEEPRVRSLFIYPVKSCKGIEVQRSRVLPTGLEFDRLYTLAQLKPNAPSALAVGQDGRIEECKGNSNDSMRPVRGDDTKAPETTVEETPPWEFITQRQHPLLATVSIDLWLPDYTKKSRLLERSSEAFLVLRFPRQLVGLKGLATRLSAKLSKGMKGVPEVEVLLPVEFPSDEEIEACGYEYANVKVWKETVRALNLERDLPAELAQYLGLKAGYRLGLFRLNPKERREVFRAAPRIDEAGYQPVIDFQDAYPLHLMNLSSLYDLDGKISKDATLKELDVRRFRSNIIVSGFEAYDEETWRRIHFHQADKHSPGTPGTARSARFDVSCRTVRCRLPNVDQDTGIRHDVEPDKSLRTYRDVDEGAPKKGCLGMQLCPLFEPSKADGRSQALPNGVAGNGALARSIGAGRLELESWIEIGMRLEVLERGSHFYVKQ